MLNEQDILIFLSGQSDKDLLTRVQDARGDIDFSKELDAYQVVWDETEKLKGYVSFDTDNAWSKLEGILDADTAPKKEKTKPAADIISIKPKKDRQRWWLAAASVILLAGASYWFLTRDPFIRVQGDNWAQVTSLPDGSVVTLEDRNSTLAYLKRFAKEPERRVFLEGNGRIDVVSNKAKPFFVENYGAAVQVIGTEFIIKSSAARSDIENVEGHVKVFEIVNPDNNADLTKPGEKAVFIPGVKIEKILVPEPVVIIPDTPGVYINIPDLISFFGWVHDAELELSPRGAYGDGIIKVDTAQGLLGILQQLDSTAQVNYIPGPDNSYILRDLRVRNR